MGWYVAGRHPGVQNQLNPGVDLFTFPVIAPQLLRGLSFGAEPPFAAWYPMHADGRIGSTIEFRIAGGLCGEWRLA